MQNTRDKKKRNTKTAADAYSPPGIVFLHILRSIEILYSLVFRCIYTYIYFLRILIKIIYIMIYDYVYDYLYLYISIINARTHFHHKYVCSNNFNEVQMS